MSPRQRTGAIVCPSCGRLVDVAEPKCPYCGRARPGLFGFVGVLKRLGDDMGFSALIIGLCIVTYGLMLWFDPQGIRNQSWFNFLSPGVRAMLAFGASGAAPIFGYGRWWTPLSAGLLHGSLLHLFFNMMSMRNLAPGVAHLYGPGRMVILFVGSSVCGFLVSSGIFLLHIPIPGLGGGELTLGASAGICGLLAALIYYGRRTGNRYIKSQTWNWILPLLALGYFMRGIVDNWAHIGGFAGGWLLSVWMDPLREERPDHVLGAIVCLVASIAAVVASVLTVIL
ncbi:MAG: rhomboid family intramembrane serine protease [Acidobacteriota bacterium]